MEFLAKVYEELLISGIWWNWAKFFM